MSLHSIPYVPASVLYLRLFCVQIPINQNVYETPYPTPRIPPPPIEITPLPAHVMTYPRPKSSPSTFGPNVEDLVFAENPSRMKNEDYHQQLYSMSPMATTKAPSPYLGGDYAPPNLSISPGRQGLIPIAPDPVGLRQMNAQKRMREEEEYSEYGQRKRKRTPSQSGPVELNEEEQLLLRLKEEENLPWKDIAVRFQTDLGKIYQVPALQMRFKRLRERMRTWSETDVSFAISFVSPSHLCSDSETGSSSRTSLRVLGEIPIRHYRRKGRAFPSSLHSPFGSSPLTCL